MSALFFLWRVVVARPESVLITKQNPLSLSQVSRCPRSPCCALNEVKSVSMPACPNDSAPAPWPNRMSAGIQKWRPRQPRPNCFQTFVPGLKVTVEEKKMETKTPTAYTCHNSLYSAYCACILQWREKDKRSEEHAFAMKKRSLWRSSGPCRSNGPLQKQETSNFRSRLARSEIFC